MRRFGVELEPVPPSVWRLFVRILIAICVGVAFVGVAIFAWAFLLLFANALGG